jgi:acyl-CoA synthetase (AMP-forming)/AMP-acid ligase II
MANEIEEFTTFTDVLRARATLHPGTVAFTVVSDGDGHSEQLTFGNLDRQARTIAAHLSERAKPGARAILLYPPGPEFIPAFFGCLYAGIIAVPTQLPHPSVLARMLPRLQSVFRDSAPSLVLTTGTLAPVLKAAFAFLPGTRGARCIGTDALKARSVEGWQAPPIDASTLALLQYTSGSTSHPKGVMVSHGNLIHNSRRVYGWLGHSAQSVYVSWLPVFHDFGLIGGVLQPIFGGFHGVQLSPLTFLVRPAAWLQAITDFGGTTSPFPNFALDLCVRRISEEQKASLDLRSWKIGICGGEPVRENSLKRFAEAFGVCGLRDAVFLPSYGLAEATLAVSAPPVGVPVKVLRVDKAAVQQHRVALAPDEQAEAVALVGCGTPSEDVDVRIIDPVTCHPSAPDAIGEVWVRGPSVAGGYWRNATATAAAFGATVAETAEGSFLRTGDLGFRRDGHLFITGRIKDLIIVRGRNLYPQDLELLAQESHSLVRRGCCAAFSIEWEGEEHVVLVAEIKSRAPRGTRRWLGPLARPDASAVELKAVSTAIYQTILAQESIKLHDVVLIRQGTISKTSSGKLQRNECRTRYLDDGLHRLNAGVAPNRQTPGRSAATPDSGTA